MPGDAVEAWTAVAREAGKRSGTPFLPGIFPARPLKELLGEGRVDGYVALPPTARPPAAGRGVGVCEASPDFACRATVSPVSLWVGPEGGLTDRETDALLREGLRPLSVGHWTLRVETAVTACLSGLIMGNGR